ncbi:GNAT family N-acetyltransferase [Leucobacter salsicius]|uniref:GNAT family N-acetyltransferase n=1 Tax=Leucobacter salsicius TaxID=664638 RepID=UPI000348A440|nr:GNAT family N-acetyltransferase [Leucobacter salsicius]
MTTHQAVQESAAIRRARHDDLASAADTLAEAFADYAWTRWVIPEHDYSARLRELQELYLRHAHAHGVVLVTEDLAGVIALLPPNAPDPDAAVMQRIIALHGDRLPRLAQGETNEPDDASGDAWRLETIGVCRVHRGRGVGAALIARGLQLAGEAGATAVTLETSDARNVALYERMQFQVVHHSTPAEGPPHWSMRAEC